MAKVSRNESPLARLSAAPVEHAGQRVVTLGMMDEVHERPEGTARRTFNRHREHLVEGRHYFRTDEKRPVGAGGKLAGREPEVFLTERGYLVLVKSFRDPLAWQVQEQLVEGYFRASEIASEVTRLASAAFENAARADQRGAALAGMLADVLRRQDRLVAIVGKLANESLRERRAARARIGFGQPRKRAAAQLGLVK